MTIDQATPVVGGTAAGMPVTLLGIGFFSAQTVTVVPTDGSLPPAIVPFTVVSDDRIDLVMPAGTDGMVMNFTVIRTNPVDGVSEQTATLVHGFTYMAPQVFQVDAAIGGVFTTSANVTVTIAPQGVNGTLIMTLTHLPPTGDVPGDLLMYSFQLSATVAGVPVTMLAGPVGIDVPLVDGLPGSGTSGQPYLYVSQNGAWMLLLPQPLDSAGEAVNVDVRAPGTYAVSKAFVNGMYFPTVPGLPPR
jgi:hypothetical protein